MEFDCFFIDIGIGWGLWLLSEIIPKLPVKANSVIGLILNSFRGALKWIIRLRRKRK